MIRFSVIIPTCNRSDSLERCLVSLRKEIGGDSSVEIVVADDGSTSEVAKLNEECCLRYNARYSYDVVNHGMAVARNRGISVAKGEWVIFLDDDVTCDSGWYHALNAAVKGFSPDVAGFEGRINPSGNGVWDREVQNLEGGACLTSHFGVRRAVVDRCGMFDDGFEHTGPYCEDHEFAVRVLKCGIIVFVKKCSVTHAPRNVHLIRYVLNAPRRCRALLRSDRYFYEKHPAEYGKFRYGSSFEDTRRAYRFRHVVDVFRRRSPATLVRHPVQTVALLIAALVEQAVSWTFKGKSAGSGGVIGNYDNVSHKKLELRKTSAYNTKTDR